MNMMKMPIPNGDDDDVGDHNCDVAAVDEHDDDGVDEDDDNDDGEYSQPRPLPPPLAAVKAAPSARRPPCPQ